MNNTLEPQDLGGLLQTLPAHTRVLSLDCFDTLLWRKVARPTDVFFSLQNTPLCIAHHISADRRIRAEQQARKKNTLLLGTHEVTLNDIYRELVLEPNEALLQALADNEIACESAHGYIFEPIAQLIDAAHKKGLRVIVVSDTYFHQKQLRHLLSNLMGDAVRSIDQVYCSCDAGKSKTTGIWSHVLQMEKRNAKEVLHLGDNENADRIGPGQFGIPSRWLKNHNDSLGRVLNDRAHVALQLMPELRHTHALPSQFHGLLAAQDNQFTTAAQQIGFRTLGPILYAFGSYIQGQLDALRRLDKPVKVAFLLRDGHMPAQACQLLMPEAHLSLINVSRFAANAASFRTKADVVSLLCATLAGDNLQATAKQLLLPADKAKQLLHTAQSSNQPEMEFVRLVLRDDTLKVIFAQSKAYRSRLMTHIQNRTGVEPGDRLVLVDLGYSGTVQNRLQAVLQDEQDIALHGVYLIALNRDVKAQHRSGLIDESWADPRLLHALIAYIGIFEMLNTNADPTIEDYTPSGEPVWSTVSAPNAQHQVTSEIQEAALRFVQSMRDTAPAFKPKPNLLELGQQAAADLGRFIYFAQREEMACMEDFNFEINLGTDTQIETANAELALAEFRRAGFSFQHASLATHRLAFPMEVRHIDASLATALLSQQRWDYGLRPAEASFRRITLALLIANDEQHQFVEEVATATTDGYFVVHLPSAAGFNLGILWGKIVEYIQIEAIERITLHPKKTAELLSLGEQVVLDGAERIGEKLYCFSENGMMFFPATPLHGAAKSMLRVTFRPITHRA
jgi:FMN phosphatase YigB (HAD superfamily)